MEELLYDPRTKKQIKDLLYNFLYDPIELKFRKQLDWIIARNTVLIGASHKSFVYKGELHSSEPTFCRKQNKLHPQMRSYMDDYLKEQKVINDREIPLVIGFITKLLNTSNTLSDYLKILPESVHRPIQKLIDSCPCRAKQLSPEFIVNFTEDNKDSIDLIKRRMVINLLI